MLAVASLVFTAGAARAEIRVLKIYHLHTHERAEIAYKKDGHYLPEGLKKLDYILRDWRRDETTRMDPRLFDLLWAVYQKSGSNDYIDVVCGYRAPETNALLRSRTRGVAERSQHTLGKAIDFFIPGVPLEKLREIGLRMEVGGVGYYPTSGSPFVHMDVGGPRHWPRMSRRQLLALFPDGKSLYVPADGKPLPRYEEALADYKARNGAAPDVELASAGAKHRGFFAFLFGGGADEREDEQDTQIASAKPVPAAKRVKETTPAEASTDVAASSQKALVVASEMQSPQRHTQKPEAIVAALPPQDVPLPLAPPRPDVDVGPAAPGDAADGGDAAQAEVAQNIPIPTRRPDYTPPVVLAAAVTRTNGNAKPAIEATSAREMAALLAKAPDEQAGARADPRPSATLAAFTAQLPSSRPVFDGGAGTLAMLPEPRPQYEPEDRAGVSPAIFRTDDTSGKEGRLVQATPRLALLDRPKGMSAEAALSSGVKTAEKHPRAPAGGESARQRSYAVPVHEEVVRWALRQERSFNPSMASRAAPSLAYNIVHSAPRMVYTGGFSPEGHSEDARHFAGSAVTFLPVARFSAN